MDFATTRMESHQSAQNDANMLPIETDGLSLKGKLLLLGISFVSAGLMSIGAITVVQYLLS
ncbi:MAG: hypothetical protein KUG59_00040 [Parvibaculaceae bacterium]|nr:hypothetical protein [Parvibaculaceae bacterium]